MDRFDKYLSILTHLITIVAIVPMLLAMGGNTYFQDLFKLRTTEVMGVKGFTYYEPALEKNTKSQSWLLANNIADASLKNLKQGDVLEALHPVNIRVGPTLKSRKAFFIPKNSCVMG